MYADNVKAKSLMVNSTITQNRLRNLISAYEFILYYYDIVYQCLTQ